MIEILMQKVKNVSVPNMLHLNKDQFPLSFEAYNKMVSTSFEIQSRQTYKLQEIESILKILTLPNNE